MCGFLLLLCDFECRHRTFTTPLVLKSLVGGTQIIAQAFQVRFLQAYAVVLSLPSAILGEASLNPPSTKGESYTVNNGTAVPTSETKVLSTVSISLGKPLKFEKEHI